jgi:hypothetical protein
MFGKRKTAPPAAPTPPSGSDPADHPGHQAVLAHLDREEASNPEQRAQLVGRLLFEWACEVLNDQQGVRMENLLAMLSSVGGHLCLVPILDRLRAEGKHPKDVGMIEVEVADGRKFYFGDLPNELLVESPRSLISLAFGAAQAVGAEVSMEMIHAEMKKVASLVGQPEHDFFTIDLPERNRTDTPLSWAKAFSPHVVKNCDLYRLNPMQRPMAIGFALYRAIEAGKGAIDPTIAASIVLQCAVRMAKVDPVRIRGG